MSAALLSCRVLSVGTCSHLEWVLMRGGAFRLRQLPCVVALLEHSREGLILFDAGLAPRVDEVRGVLGRLYPLVVPFWITHRQTAATQLKRLGLAPDQVRTVVISHLHPDHIGGLRDFRNARFVLARRAWDAAASGAWHRLRSGFMPELLPGDFIERTQLVDSFDDGRLGPFAIADLFGDGSLSVVDLPGHAAGHMGLLARLPGSRPRLFSADACWLSEAIDRGTVPPAPVRLIVDQWAAQERTVAGLCRLRAAMPELSIVPSHCPTVGVEPCSE